MSQTIENLTIKDAGVREDCKNLETTACQAVRQPKIDAAYLRSLLESYSECLFGGHTFLSNRQVFLVSCLGLQFAFFVDIGDMKADVLLGGLKQIRHHLLVQPNRLVFKTHVNFYPTVFCLINQELALLGEIRHT